MSGNLRNHRENKRTHTRYNNQNTFKAKSIKSGTQKKIKKSQWAKQTANEVRVKKSTSRKNKQTKNAARQERRLQMWKEHFKNRLRNS